MDEIILVIVDVLQLMLELEHVLHAVLQKRDGMPTAAATPLGNARPFGCDQLVQQHVVLLEFLVELVVVRLLANVHGADQVDRHVVLVGRLRL